MNQNVQNAPRYQLIKEEVELIIFKMHAITVILKSSESMDTKYLILLQTIIMWKNLKGKNFCCGHIIKG